MTLQWKKCMILPETRYCQEDVVYQQQNQQLNQTWSWRSIGYKPARGIWFEINCLNLTYKFLLGQQLSPKKLQSSHNKNTIFRNILLHRVHPMCDPPMCNIVPNLQDFFEEFVFCLVSRNNFNSKMTKINRNELNMVFKMIKLTSKTVSHHLYQNILPLFTKRWPMFFKMGKKRPIFYQKFHLYFFRAMSPMCNNVPNVQHFLGEFRCCTLVAPGVSRNTALL